MSTHWSFGFNSPIRLNQLNTFRNKFDEMNRIGLFQEKESLTAFLTAIIRCCDVLIDCKSKNEPAPFLKIIKKEFHYGRAKRKQMEKVEHMRKTIKIEEKKLIELEGKEVKLLTEELEATIGMPEIEEVFTVMNIRSREDQKRFDDDLESVRRRELEVRVEYEKIKANKIKIDEERESLEKLKSELKELMKSTVAIDSKRMELEEKIIDFNIFVTRENKRIDIYKKIMSSLDVDFEMIPPEHHNVTKYDLFSYINERGYWGDFTDYKNKRTKVKYAQNIVPAQEKTIKQLEPEVKANIEANVEVKVIVDADLVENIKQKFDIANERVMSIRRIVGNRESNWIDLLESNFERLQAYQVLDDFELVMKKTEIFEIFRNIMSIANRH